MRNLPMRSSDTSLKDGLLHMYRKLDRGVTVKVVGQGSDRAFIIRFNKLEDVDKALEFSRDKFLFDRKIEATPWDSDLEPEPKSSRNSSTAVQNQLGGSFSSPASGNQKTKESKSTTTNSTTCTNALKSSSSIAGLESSKLKSSSKSGGGQSSSSSVSKKESDKGKEKRLEEERERRKKKQNSSKTSATISVSSTSSAPTSAGTPSSASSTEGTFRIPHPHGTSASPFPVRLAALLVNRRSSNNTWTRLRIPSAHLGNRGVPR